MTGRSRVAGSARTSRRISSPLRPGSIRSSTRRSGREANNRRSPSSPSATAVTRNPERSRLYRTRSRISRSSSMTITKSAMLGRHAREHCEAGQSPSPRTSWGLFPAIRRARLARRRFPTHLEARLERARVMANPSLRKEAESESGVTASDLVETWRLLTPEDRYEAFMDLPRPEAEDFFFDLSARDQLELVESMPPGQGLRRSWLRLLPPDDAADLIQEVADDAKREELLGLLDEQTRREV